MDRPSQVSAVMEDYLETIYHLVIEEGNARPQKIADRMKVHKSTVTSTLKTLAQQELVNYAPYQAVTLTDAGQRIAEGVVGRHDALRGFLQDILGLPADIAEESACGMEHAVTGETSQRLADFVDFFRFCHREDNSWRKCFQRFCSQKDDSSEGNVEQQESDNKIAKCLVDRCDSDDCPIYAQTADLNEADDTARSTQQ